MTVASGLGRTAASSQGARLRAAVVRMHAAQLAALPALADRLVAGRDAYGAQRQLLAQMADMGSLLAQLGRLTPADAVAVEIRRRLVRLAVGCAITLAELVCLAFELEALAPADASDCAPGHGPDATAPEP
jgi:hypothetical protein